MCLTEEELCKYIGQPKLDKKMINLLAIMKKYHKIVEIKEFNERKYSIP